MSTQEQMRRGTKAETDVFTGALAETTYDTTNNRQVNHDGSTAGGIPVPNYRDIIGQSFQAGDASGTDTYTLTLAYSPIAYAEYQRFTFKASNNNTGAATLNVNSLGAKNIKKDDGTGVLVDLEADDIKAGIVHHVDYDGTDFILQTGGSGSTGWVLVDSVSGTGAKTLTFDSNYKHHVLVVTDQTHSNAATLLNVQLRISSTAQTFEVRRSYTGSTQSASSWNPLQTAPGGTGLLYTSMTLYLYNITTTNNQKWGKYSAYSSRVGTTELDEGVIARRDASAFDDVVINVASGASGGDVKLYGITEDSA